MLEISSLLWLFHWIDIFGRSHSFALCVIIAAMLPVWQSCVALPAHVIADGLLLWWGLRGRHTVAGDARSSSCHAPIKPRTQIPVISGGVCFSVLLTFAPWVAFWASWAVMVPLIIAAFIPSARATSKPGPSPGSDPHPRPHPDPDPNVNPRGDCRLGTEPVATSEPDPISPPNPPLRLSTTCEAHPDRGVDTKAISDTSFKPQPNSSPSPQCCPVPEHREAPAPESAPAAFGCRKGVAFSAFCMSRHALARARPSSHRHRLHAPWATLAILLAIQTVYFIDTIALHADAAPPILRAAEAAAGHNGTPWWWGLFSNAYNGGEFVLHMHLGGNAVFLGLYGAVAEAAWGPVYVYSVPLAACLLQPHAFGRCGGLGTSVLVSAVVAHVWLTAAAGLCYFARARQRMCAVSLWGWLMLVPCSFFAGNVCHACHGEGLLLGIWGSMALAAANAWPMRRMRIGGPEADAQSDAQYLRSAFWWYCGLGAVGTLGSVVLIALALTQCKWGCDACVVDYGRLPGL